MAFDSTDIHLEVRQSQADERRRARQALMQAAMGRGDSGAGAAPTARGAISYQREDSIFSDVWLLVTAIILGVGFLNGRNPALLALGLVLLIILAVSHVWRNLALYGVSYTRQFDRDHAFPGEPITMTFSVTNEKPLPLTWLRVRDKLPVSPETDNIISQAATEIAGGYFLNNNYAMHAWERVNRTTTLYFRQRGYYALGPVTYRSGDVFTLFTIEREHKDLDTLIIYPQIYPLEELGLPAKEPFGELKVRRSLFTDPIKTQGIRDYQPQDRFRDVHWKATARRGHLQTKVYDPSTGMTMAVFLNVATFAKHWMGFNPDQLERAISVAGSIASFGTESGWAVGMYANGAMPNADQPLRVQPGRSPNQLTHVLEALAAVTEFATGSIERMLVEESPNLPWASTIVLVTAVVTDEIMVTLLRLKEAGRRVVLISLAEAPPPTELGTMLTYHVPPDTAVFQNGSTTEAALSRIPTPGLADLQPTEEPTDE